MGHGDGVGRGYPGGNGGMDRGPYPGGQRPPGGFGAWRQAPDPTPDQWADIEAFMKENSPYRLSMFHKVEADNKDPNLVSAAKKRIVWRYNNLTELKNGPNKDLYDFALKQLQLEDRVMGLMDQAQNGDSSPELQAKIEQNIADFVNNHLAERDARLKRLQEAVAQQTAAIANDRANFTDLAKKQRDQFSKEMDRMTRLGGPDRDDRPSTPPSTQPTTQAGE